jgi:hypothetical protein
MVHTMAENPKPEPPKPNPMPKTPPPGFGISEKRDGGKGSSTK